MSVFRIITRIIPLNGSETSFQPASFDQLTGENVKDIEIFHVTDPASGVNYRIERIKEFHDVGPEETTDSVNQAFAEKIEKIPGFVELKENDTQVNPHARSLQLSIPQVISADDEVTDPLNVSVVENVNFKKLVPENNEEPDDTESTKEIPMTKLPCNVGKKYKQKYRWRSKRRSARKSRKTSKSDWNENSSRRQQYETASQSNQTSDEEDDHETNIEEPTVKSPTQEPVKFDECLSSLDNIENKDVCAKIATMDKDISKFFFNFSDTTDLATNEPQSMDSLLKDDQVDLSDNNIDNCSSSSATVVDRSPIFEDNNINNDNSSDDDQSCSRQMSDSNSADNVANINICTQYIVPFEHPLYDYLEALKKYFVSGECLVCGFLSADRDFNAATHMETHISSNASYSCYKCACCNEKFCSPRSLYTHSLSRVKSFEYRCDICLLKFKRKHFLLSHNSKKH